MSETRQGKCPDCRIAFRWEAKFLPLKFACCPYCAGKLVATTYLLQWKWEEKKPIDIWEATRIKATRDK